MKVSVRQNPLHPEGFSVSFPYNPDHVDKIKKCLGFGWNKSRKVWESLGPEVMLDMLRFGIDIGYLAPDARIIAEEFRQQLWDSIDIRAQPIDEELYGYQKYGSKFLASMPNSILADEMGTGKSKQALDAAVLVGSKKTLIVCPKTLCYNWLYEVQKWHPEITAAVVPDAKKEREAFWKNPTDLIITNYEKLLISDWPRNFQYDCLIIDEATKCKNSATQTYKAVKNAAKHSRYTWALTGTPLEIRLPELYNILCLLRPAVLGSFMRFRDQHCITDWAGTVVGSKNLELLRERIGPFMLRRTKKEVLPQLPQKLPPQNQYVKLSLEEQKAYQAMTSEFNNWLDEQGVSGSDMPMLQTLRMRQFCCTPTIFTDDLGQGSKFLALQDIINEWPGKIVVFCYFEEVIEKLHSWLGCHQDAIISGKVTANDGERIRRANEFSAGKLGKVFVSTDAGGMGINIVGADLIIHYDQLWNPQKMHQREDRLHRIGQQSNVTVMNMLCIDTVDYGMWLLNRERDELFVEVVDGAEEMMLKKIDAARWKKIVAGRE